MRISMINGTLSAVTEPLGNTVGDIMGVLTTIVGGLFGLYVIYTIFLILRWKETRQLKKSVKKLEKSIKDMEYIVENLPQTKQQESEQNPSIKKEKRANPEKKTVRKSKKK